MNESLSDRQIQLMEIDMLVEMDRICRENNLRYYLAYGTVLGAVRHKGFIPWDTDIDIITDMNNYERLCDAIYEKISDKYVLISIKTDKTYDSLKARIGLANELHNDMHIDIYPIAGAPKSKLGRKLFSKLSYMTYRSFFVKKVRPNINYEHDLKKKIFAYIAKGLLICIPSRFFIWIFNKLSSAFPIEDFDMVCNICGTYGYKELIPKSYLAEPVYMEFEGHELPVPKEWHKYLTHMYGDYMTPKKENYV